MGKRICMKKVGIVGGIGPASTLDYYKYIIEGYRAITKNNEYPKIIIDSINMTEMMGYLSENRWDELVSLLVCSIKSLASAGANFVAIASNTPHIVFDEVKKQSAIPLISIVDETCKYALNNGCKKVVVLGTSFTMSSGLYTNAFGKYDIEAFVPDIIDQNAIHSIIFPSLEEGIVLPNEKSKMLDIAKKLIRTHNADALVLGCTELPLMIQQNDIETMTLNTTQIHIKSIIKRLLV